MTQQKQGAFISAMLSVIAIDDLFEEQETKQLLISALSIFKDMNEDEFWIIANKYLQNIVTQGKAAFLIDTKKSVSLLDESLRNKIFIYAVEIAFSQNVTLNYKVTQLLGDYATSWQIDESFKAMVFGVSRVKFS